MLKTITDDDFSEVFQDEISEYLKTRIDDFISLDMQISTGKNQIAVGTGEFKSHWQDANRNYYKYQAVAIPFRFAVSSAAYEVKKIQHKGCPKQKHN